MSNFSSPRHPELVSGSHIARALVHVILKQVQNDRIYDDVYITCDDNNDTAIMEQEI